MPADQPQAPVLTFKFENSRPVELADLTASLQALARRFSRFVVQNDLDLDSDSVKLYVRKISEGSIVVDLTNYVATHGTEVAEYSVGALAGGVLFTQANAIVTFAKNIRDGLNYLLGRGEKPEDMPTSELKDLSKLVEPLAKDRSATLNISASDGATVQVSINYNSVEANAIQNRAEREIQSRHEPAQTRFQKVLMYWHQASKGLKSQSDKVVIERITDKPLKVIFDDADANIKRRMLSGKDNPFNIGFLVDVEMITKQGKPVAYQVIHLYEVLEDDNSDAIPDSFADN